MVAQGVKIALFILLACVVVTAVVLTTLYIIKRSSPKTGTSTYPSVPVATPTSSSAPTTAIVYRYNNPSTGMHQNTLSATAPSSSWLRDPTQFSVYTAQVAGTVPLYAMQNPSNANGFMTSIIAAEGNWTTLGVLGYVWAAAPSATASVPVYRMYNNSAGDHMSSLVNTEGSPYYVADGRTWFCPQPTLSIGRRLRSFLTGS